MSMEGEYILSKVLRFKRRHPGKDPGAPVSA